MKVVGLDLSLRSAGLVALRDDAHVLQERRIEDGKKTDGPLVLELVRNPDILAGLGASRTGDRPVLVGFALETRDVLENARGKLARKSVDLIVANHASDSFGKPTNRVTLVSAEGDEPLPELDKGAVADRILDWLASRLA